MPELSLTSPLTPRAPPLAAVWMTMLPLLVEVPEPEVTDTEPPVELVAAPPLSAMEPPTAPPEPALIVT